ncbi:MAG: GTPase ObgE [Calditrichia bacterium]
MFLDYAKIYVKGGQGGSGCCSFRREKFVAKGGPDGGDGGRGGSVIINVDPQLRTLIDFKYRSRYQAPRGQHGMGSNKHGRKGKDIILKVPPGTVIKDAESGTVLADMTGDQQEFIVAKGGRGGKGNARFATPTHRAPREWEVGESGEERWIELELKLIADVGLVGKPNAGKSTLLASISAARPKIADYPFTTLKPNLGIVTYQSYKSFVVADIPGLIEGAHQGKGLGLQFLRHIERTNLIAYLIDPTDHTGDDPVVVFDTLRNELAQYSTRLVEKPAIVVFTKKDAWEEEGLIEKYRDKFSYPVLGISSVTGEGLPELKKILWEESQKVKNNFKEESAKNGR